DGADGAGAAAEGDRGEEVPPRRRHPRSARRLPPARGDEPRSAGRSRRGTVSQRPLLPVERGAAAHAAAARADGGPADPRRGDSASAVEGDGAADAEDVAARDEEA